MNTSATLALDTSLNTQTGDAPTAELRDPCLLTPAPGLADAFEPRPTEQLTERQHSVVRVYATRTAANLRSIVERRFRRMSEAHDRIRTELLARDPPHER